MPANPKATTAGTMRTTGTTPPGFRARRSSTCICTAGLAAAAPAVDCSADFGSTTTYAATSPFVTDFTVQD